MSDNARFEAALQSETPYETLRQLAIDFADEGHGPERVLQLFESFRVTLRNSNREHDEDRLLDVMDCIIGWCSEEAKLFPTHTWVQE